MLTAQLLAATDADIALLRTWFKTADDLLLWGGPSMQNCKATNAFASMLGNNNFTSYSLYAKNHFVGFGQIQRHSAHRVHLGRLVIKPTLRGQGLSHLLLEQLFMLAQKQYKATQVSLFVYRSNTYAHHTYIKNGFVSVTPPKGMLAMQGCDYMLKQL